MMRSLLIGEETFKLQIYGEDFAADENATEAASIYDDS
jgi:hypothetical protein